MFFPTLQMTSAGQALLSKVVGESKVLAFSRMAIGDGATAGTTGLTHQAINSPINYYSLSTGAVSMTGTLDNSSLQSGVNARELGVFAIDPDDESEILYAYSFNGDNPAYIPPASSSSYERIALSHHPELSETEYRQSLLLRGPRIQFCLRYPGVQARGHLL